MRRKANQIPSIKELPPIKVYECGKCLQKTFGGIQELWNHFETCGDPLPDIDINYWDE